MVQLEETQAELGVVALSEVRIGIGWVVFPGALAVQAASWQSFGGLEMV